MLVYLSVHIFVSGYLQDIGNSERVLVFVEKKCFVDDLGSQLATIL